MGGPNKITNFHLNTKKQKSWFWWPLSRKNHLQGVPEPDPNAFKAFKRGFKTISKNHWKPIQKPLQNRPPKKLVFAIYTYIYIAFWSNLLWHWNGKRVSEVALYSAKEIQGRLVINANIDKTYLTACFHLASICLCSCVLPFSVCACERLLDIGFAA